VLHGRLPRAVDPGLRAEGVLIKSRALAAFLAAAVLSLGTDAGLRRAHDPRFPPLSTLSAGPYILQDSALAAAGFRAAAADLAWIELLQYAAGVTTPGYEDEPGRPYTHLKEMALRVGRLDPSFHRAFLYGAGMLGWFHGVQRPDEAAEILEEGIRLAPDQPQFKSYLAALAYQKQGDPERMIAVLEESFDRPDTPTMMKTILANIRQSRGELKESLELWERIRANDRDRAEHGRAAGKIAELKALLRRKAR
jgi:tetratricopeptide (TPR) repeat protein